jgi:hypothetical protein
MKTKKFILYKEDGAVIDLFEEVESATILDNSGQNIDVISGEGTVSLRGTKSKYILLPEDIDVDDVITEDIASYALDIPKQRTQEDEVRSIKRHFYDMHRVLNEVSRQFIRSESMTETDRKELVGQFRKIEVGNEVDPGEVVNIGGKLFEMIQGSPVTIVDESWIGDPSLFADFINPTTREGEKVVDEYQQPAGAHDAYQTGDAVLFDGVMYESLMDNNVYSPTDYPQGWELMEPE